MNKCNISISRKMTINTGNFSNIQPNVLIEMKDVYVEDIEKTYKNMETIMSALFIEEINNLSDLQNDINKVSYNKLYNLIDKKSMNDDMKESIQKLSGIPSI